MSRIVRSTDLQSALRSRQRGFLLNPFRFGGGGGGSYVAPSFKSILSSYRNTGGYNISFTSGYSANDLAIIVIERSGSDSSQSAPSGWNELPGSPIVDVANTTGSKLQIFYKVLSASESTVSVIDGGDHQISSCILFSGVDISTPINSSSISTETVASSSAMLPSVTTDKNNTLIVFVASRPDDNASTSHFGSPSNGLLTSVTDILEEGYIGGNGGGYAISCGVMATSGVLGTTSMTKAVSTTGCYATIALSGMPA